MNQLDKFTYPVIDWMTLAPMIIVMVTGMIALIVERARPRSNNDMVVGVSLAGLAVAAWSVFAQFGAPAGETFQGMMRRDQLGLLLQLVLIGVTAVCFLFSEGYLRQKKVAFGEFYPLALFSASGGMIMAASANLLMLFLGLEVLSIALYCLCGLARDEAKSEESSLKYFLLGAFASAFLLMGIAFVYGASGSVHLVDIHNLIPKMGVESKTFAIFGTILMLVGLGFKLALVPFHQWTPDVYQGAPTNVTAFMAVASKVAALGMTIRVLQGLMPLHPAFFDILFWIAVATMIVGNLGALVQRDVKRMLGYSSIANAGYLLAGLLAHLKMPDKVDLSAIVFFLGAYAVMTLGIFAVISLTASDGREGSSLRDLNGLFKKSPLAAGMLVLFVASLIGIPPTGGFFAKWQIFNDLIASGYMPLALILAVTSILSAAYYLQILVSAFVTEDTVVENRFGPSGPGHKAAMWVCAFGALAAAIFLTGVSGFIKGEGDMSGGLYAQQEAATPSLPPPTADSETGQ